MADSKTSHPSYGSISFRRMQGCKNLFGSSVTHNNYVSVVIHEAELIEGESGYTALFPKKQIIEVDLTEAQLAQLITDWNNNEGTPCTISRRPDPSAKLVMIEDPPSEVSAKDRMEDLLKESFSRLRQDITSIVTEIDELVSHRLPKKDKERLRILLSVLRDNPSSNLGFANSMMHEVLERSLAKAKVEMEAAATNVLRKMGIAKVTEEMKSLLPKFD
jgi:hypothetical protein